MCFLLLVNNFSECGKSIQISFFKEPTIATTPKKGTRNI